MLAIVPVATPNASVTPGWTSVLLLPVAASCTACPATGLPVLSRTVTVIVENAVPSAITPVAGDAVAVVRVALIVVGLETNCTVGCCATTTWLTPGLTVAVMVFVSAVVEAIVPVATPKTSVGLGWTSVLLLPVEASCTTWPATGLPLTSRTVTVIVEVLEPSAGTVSVGAAVAVDNSGLIVLGSPTKSTVGCCATTIWLAPGFTVAVIVLSSAVVLAIVPVATPNGSVRPGWTSVLLLPVEARATAWPAIVLPLLSRTVTVIVDTDVPSAMTPIAGDAVAVVMTPLMLFGSPT